MKVFTCRRRCNVTLHDSNTPLSECVSSPMSAYEVRKRELSRVRQHQVAAGHRTHPCLLFLTVEHLRGEVGWPADTKSQLTDTNPGHSELGVLL